MSCNGKIPSRQRELYKKICMWKKWRVTRGAWLREQDRQRWEQRKESGRCSINLVPLTSDGKHSSRAKRKCEGIQLRWPSKAKSRGEKANLMTSADWVLEKKGQGTPDDVWMKIAKESKKLHKISIRRKQMTDTGHMNTALIRACWLGSYAIL